MNIMHFLTKTPKNLYRKLRFVGNMMHIPQIEPKMFTNIKHNNSSYF